MSDARPLPVRWCRFCKAETGQLIDDNNDHKRVCAVCWRRQKDGALVEIVDGPEDRPTTIPPPPRAPQPCPPLDDYVTRVEFNDALRRIKELELHNAKF